MTGAVIADSGPLVALFDAGDSFHDWATGVLARLEQPLLVSEAVVSEVMFLLAPLRKSRAAFEEFWLEGGLRVAFDAEAHRDPLVALLRKYADLPMSLADATVVRMSEIQRAAVVWTLDRHFHIYRRLGRRAIPLLDWPRG